MKLWKNLRYKLLGPFWPEYLVAQELRKKGWKVYRQFYCYDPKKSQYVEIDILAVSHDGFVIAEVKSYQGDWESLDNQPKPMWRKVGWRKQIKSPVWQVKRARLALINTLLRAYPNMDVKILNSCQTYVFLDRGIIVNATDTAVCKAWANMQVQVLPLAARVQLPTATMPAAETFLVWLEQYRNHFKWKLHYKLLHKLGRLNSHLQTIDNKWQGLL